MRSVKLGVAVGAVLLLGVGLVGCGREATPTAHGLVKEATDVVNRGLDGLDGLGLDCTGGAIQHTTINFIETKGRHANARRAAEAGADSELKSYDSLTPDEDEPDSFAAYRSGRKVAVFYGTFYGNEEREGGFEMDSFSACTKDVVDNE